MSGVETAVKHGQKLVCLIKTATVNIEMCNVSA